jgi:hypothetical protein
MDAPVAAPEEEEPFISLNAITGMRGDDTLQVRVTVGMEELTALLDSGSTTNFISSAAGCATRLCF